MSLNKDFTDAVRRIAIRGMLSINHVSMGHILEQVNGTLRTDESSSTDSALHMVTLTLNRLQTMKSFLIRMVLFQLNP